MSPVDFSRALDREYVGNLLRAKSTVYFPELKGKNFSNLEIKRISPEWATDTVVAKYIFRAGGREYVFWGTGSNLSSKKAVYKISQELYVGGAPIARPLDFAENLNLLISADAPGASFARRLSDGVYIDSDVCAVGSALAKFHSVASRGRIRTARSFGLKDYKRAARLVSSKLPEIILGDDVLQMFNTVSDRAVSEFRGLCHGDFYPANVMIEGESAMIIDLDYAGIGNQILDVAMFSAFFDFPPEMSDLKISQSSVASLRKVFLDAYVAARSIQLDSIQKVLKWHTAKALLDQFAYHSFFETKDWNKKSLSERQVAAQKIGKLLRAAEKYYVEAKEVEAATSGSLL